MLVADEFLGTLDDPEIAARVAERDCLGITVDDTERRRSRVRTTAEDGTDLGIVVARELRDGDVLSADGTLVVVSLEPTDALVLDFGEVAGSETEIATAALALGHAVGNRHWDLAIEGDCAYLPVTERPERMEDEVVPHIPDGATVGYDEVSPAMFDDDANAGQDHSHGHSHDGDHSHGDGHGHDHTHSGSHGHDHSHGADHPVHGIDPNGGDPE